MTPLRVGAFLSARLLPFYESATAAAGKALDRDAVLVTDMPLGALADGGLDAAILCGLPYVDLHDRADGVVALAAPAGRTPGHAARPRYFSDVLARAGEGGSRLEDFAGRVLAVNEPDSHSGYNVVASTLAEREVPAGGFSRVVVTGGHAESVAALRSGEADVAAVDSHLLAAMRAGDPGIDAELMVVESLGPSPSQPFAAGPGLDGEARERVRAALTALAPVDLAPGLEGVAWLAVEDGDYDPIRRMRDAARRRGSF